MRIEKKMIHFEGKKITLFNIAYVCIFLLFRSLNKREKRERNERETCSNLNKKET